MSQILKPVITSTLEWARLKPVMGVQVMILLNTYHKKVKPRNLKDSPKNSKQLERFLLSFFFFNKGCQ